MSTHNFGPENQPVYRRFKTAIVSVLVGGTTFPSVECGLVCVKSPLANAATITLGEAGVIAGVGWTLEPGDMTPWIPVDNLNRITAVSSDGTQPLEVMYL